MTIELWTKNRNKKQQCFILGAWGHWDFFFGGSQIDGSPFEELGFMGATSRESPQSNRETVTDNKLSRATDRQRNLALSRTE